MKTAARSDSRSRSGTVARFGADAEVLDWVRAARPPAEAVCTERILAIMAPDIGVWWAEPKGGSDGTIVGSGKYTYAVHEDWARLPEGVEMKAAAVAVDSQDRVYCFNRVDEHPILVFDRDGNFLTSWGPDSLNFRTPSASTRTIPCGSPTGTTCSS